MKKFLPWYNFNLINFLDKFLQKDFDVFEYGAGNSTIYYAEKVKNVCAIETRQEWFDFVVNSSPANGIVKIKLCQDLPNFNLEIAHFGIKKFDVIVVDSRDRAKCLLTAVNFLKPAGIIILDNSERGNLASAKETMKELGFAERVFEGLRDDGNIAFSSVFSKI
jgi:hypothetical protein